MEGLHGNLCQLARERMKEQGMNYLSFDENNNTVSNIMRGNGGTIKKYCSMLEQMGVKKVSIDGDTVLFESKE